MTANHPRHDFSARELRRAARRDRTPTGDQRPDPLGLDDSTAIFMSTLTHVRRPLPILVIEHGKVLAELDLDALADSGQIRVVRDHVLETTVGLGLTYVTDLFSEPPDAPGWKIAFNRRGGGVYNATGEPFFEPLPPVDEAWPSFAAVRGLHAALLVVSGVDVRGNAGNGSLPARIMAAARVNRVVGGWVRVEPPAEFDL